MNTTSTQNYDAIIPLAKQIVQMRAGFVRERILNVGWGENTAEVFYKNYQNPILTTAEYLFQFSKNQYYSYAGTGGWGCYGPPPRFPFPIGEIYPLLLDPMWIRDACAQYHGYLGIFSHPEMNGGDSSTEEYRAQVDALGTFIEGLIRTCCFFLMKGPGNITAHAFDRQGNVVEKTFESDSLAYVIFLAADYERASGNHGHLDSTFWKTMNAFVTTLSKPEYLISVGDDLALIHSSHRPSDDLLMRKFNIPVNAFIAAMMDRLVDLANKYLVKEFHLEAAKSLSERIANAINTSNIGYYDYLGHRNIYAFETDAGCGEKREPIFMDDAGIPNLMSLPYLGFCSSQNDIYENTRVFLLSPDNPFYFEGGIYKGNGSPHTAVDSYQWDKRNPQGIPCYGYGSQVKGIWPMAVIMQGMTSTEISETRFCVETLVASTQYDGRNSGYGCDFVNQHRGDTHPASWYRDQYPNKDYMRESFEADAPDKITRGWFSWVDVLFGEFMEGIVIGHTSSK